MPKRATSANNTTLRFPDSPEGVALALAYLIDQSEPTPDLLTLYRQCLRAVNGDQGWAGPIEYLKH